MTSIKLFKNTMRINIIKKDKKKIKEKERTRYNGTICTFCFQSHPNIETMC